MRDAEKTVGNMIDKLKTAFIGSIDSEGFPNMKAMLQPRKREGIKTIYLTTNTSSMRVAQYRENNHACIYFCDTRFFRGVMLRGTMEVLTDPASKEMIWQGRGYDVLSRRSDRPRLLCFKIYSDFRKVLQ